MPSAPRQAPSPPPERFFKVHRRDARTLDALLGPHSSPSKPLLTATITSPPYGDLKNYGDEQRQIGHGQSPDEYRADLRRVFEAVYDHTRDDGCLWMVVDTLRSSRKGLSKVQPLPFELAADLEQIGWTLHDVIVWRKDKTLPWSGQGRLRNAFEYVLYFVKSPTFKYAVDRLRDPYDLEEWWVKWPERYHPLGKVPSNVWDFPIPVQGSWRKNSIQHACPLPPELIERMLLLSTDPGDVVLDPFAGSGVVIAEAKRMERQGIGTELVESYVKAYESIVRPEILGPGHDVEQQRERSRQELRETIVNLRALKYPRVLMRGLARDRPELPRPAMALTIVDKKRKRHEKPHQVVTAKTVFVFDNLNGEVSALQEALDHLASNKPASKFGVGGQIEIVGREDVPAIVGRRQLFLYTAGQTYRSAGRIAAGDLQTLKEEPNRASCPPIVANVEVDERPRRRSQQAADEQPPEPAGRDDDAPPQPTALF